MWKLVLQIIFVTIIFPNVTVCGSNIMSEMLSFFQQSPIQDATYHHEYPFDKAPIFNDEKFDFIIIGSGTAGSVIANRLSEVKDWNILLIEAGKPESLITDIPGICGLLQLTDYNWGYKMARQNGTCLAMIDQQCSWPRGKALGGSSVINYMMYTRGNHYDYDRWAAQGNPGWSWKDVLPYFMRSEKSNLRFQDPELHGTNGYMSVEDVPIRSPLVHAFLDAAQETGRKILDYNGRNQFGFSYVQAHLRNGRRCSAAKAFIEPARLRKNLRILTHTRATKILINPKTKTAYGVEYLRNKKRYRAFATREVILSAGAFASPQLLMLSGIGPKDHLKELGIPLIQDLSVGKNLQDHVTFMGLTFFIDKNVSFTLEKGTTMASFLDYFVRRTGPLTTLGGVEGIGYIKTNESKELGDIPDIELIFLAGGLNSDRGGPFKITLRMTDEFFDTVFRDYGHLESWSIIPVLLSPKSVGHLKLKSKNIFHHPILYGNYYTDPENHDAKTMVAAIKESIRLAETRAFRKFNTRLHTVPFPTCSHLEFGSDPYWHCAAHTMSTTLHHQLGTCKMGPATDPNAVVTPELKVYGIKRLRVADTSIIPFALSAHTNAPTFMIGEKASDIIKKFWLTNQRAL